MTSSNPEAFESALADFRSASFDAELLAAASEAWSDRAQNEHASVAAFDRFSLGLLAVAAPPELLEASHRAALDEIFHARLGFALASAYAGQPLGPGPLKIDGALDDVTTLPSLVRATITEGCIGETLSAMEIQECIAATTEPAARIALEIIADDEARHAELAWAFVRWALGIEPKLEGLVRATFSEALPRAAADDSARCHEPRLATFGFSPQKERHAQRARAVASVLTPAAKALVDR